MVWMVGHIFHEFILAYLLKMNMLRSDWGIYEAIHRHLEGFWPSTEPVNSCVPLNAIIQSLTSLLNQNLSSHLQLWPWMRYCTCIPWMGVSFQSQIHQENIRVIFGGLWGLWKDLKTSKTLRLHVFWETGTYSSRDMVIFERHLRIFQRWAESFTKTIFSFECCLYKSLSRLIIL